MSKFVGPHINHQIEASCKVNLKMVGGYRLRFVIINVGEDAVNKKEEERLDICPAAAGATIPIVAEVAPLKPISTPYVPEPLPSTSIYKEIK